MWMYLQTVVEFNRVRQPIGDGLADLSLENYVEMRSKTAKPWWVAKRKLELVQYISGHGVKMIVV